MMRLNTEQAAIMNADGDIFVKAGAGTGKTSTMVEKFVHAIENASFEVHDILAITFTDKAATEMRDRILYHLQKRLFDPQVPSEKKKILQRAVLRLPFAWISTIHGFCSRLLREYPLQAGLDPSFEILPQYAQKEGARKACLQFFSGTNAISRLEDLGGFLQTYRYERTIQILMEALKEKRYEMMTIQDRPLRTDLAHAEEEKLLQKSLPMFFEAFNSIHEASLQENQWMNMLGFEDLQILAMRLLEKHESIRQAVNDRFRMIIVDEFQDTNELQKKIISLARGPQTQLIYVGDGKQSIYRFRQADVRVFNRTMRQFPPEAARHLDTNYRSEPALLSFFNTFFSRVMDKGEESYQIQYEPLRSGKEQDPSLADHPAVFLLPIVKEWENEVELVCGAIRRNHTQGQAYREMAILLRRMTHVDDLERALDRWAIPYYVAGSRYFFQKPEIVSLCSLIHIVVDPLDDFEYLSLLRSYLSPFSDSEIVALRSLDKTSFHAALEMCAKEDSTAAAFLEKIEALRRLYLFSSPKTLVQSCIERFQYDILLGMMAQSRRKLLNLQKFQEITANYSRASSWKDFLFHIGQRSEIDEGEAVCESEQSDLVRIMTIHKSKGLEFDTVFLPDICMRNTSRVDDRILINPEENLIGFQPPKASEIEGGYSLLKQQEVAMNTEENKRILYVGMTRAKKRLFLSGSINRRGEVSNFVFLPFLLKGGLMEESFQWVDLTETDYAKLVRMIPETELQNPEPAIPEEIDLPALPEQLPQTAHPIADQPYRKHLSPSQLFERQEDPDHRLVQALEGSEEEAHDPWHAEIAIKRSRLGIMYHHALQLVGHMPLESITQGVLEQRAFWEGMNQGEARYAWRMIQKWQKNPPELIAQIEESRLAKERVLSEKKVMRQWGRYILNGVIDKLFFHKGVWKVLEFKSGRFQQELFDNQHRFQAQFYLFCLQAIHEDEPMEAHVLYLREEKPIRVVLEEDFESRLRDWVDEKEKTGEA